MTRSDLTLGDRFKRRFDTEAVAFGLFGGLAFGPLCSILAFVEGTSVPIILLATPATAIACGLLMLWVMTILALFEVTMEVI